MYLILNSSHRMVRRGYTLLELAMVLVIVSLLVGGVLVGRDLIKAAELRGQINQIDQFNQASHTFELKYGALPGDLNAAIASKFNFAARGSGVGQGDNDGFIQGNHSGFIDGSSQNGETILFWNDLSKAALIPGQYSGVSNMNVLRTITSPTYPLANYLPAALLRSGNFMYIYHNFGLNHFAIGNYLGSASIGTDGVNRCSNYAISVTEAFGIDSKMDDASPQTGIVRAVTGCIGGQWSGAFASSQGGNNLGGTNTAAYNASTTTCFDNGGVAGRDHHYSTNVLGGDYVNCSLLFRFQ